MDQQIQCRKKKNLYPGPVQRPSTEYPQRHSDNLGIFSRQLVVFAKASTFLYVGCREVMTTKGQEAWVSLLIHLLIHFKKGLRSLFS